MMIKRINIHWKKWKDISKVKGKGGLEFCEIQYFNTDLLARYVWRIMTTQNLFVSKVVKGRYFPNSTILETKKQKRSFVNMTKFT